MGCLHLLLWTSLQGGYYYPIFKIKRNRMLSISPTSSKSLSLSLSVTGHFPFKNDLLAFGNNVFWFSTFPAVSESPFAEFSYLGLPCHVYSSWENSGSCGFFLPRITLHLYLQPRQLSMQGPRPYIQLSTQYLHLNVLEAHQSQHFQS